MHTHNLLGFAKLLSCCSQELQLIWESRRACFHNTVL